MQLVKAVGFASSYFSRFVGCGFIIHFLKEQIEEFEYIVQESY